MPTIGHTGNSTSLTDVTEKYLALALDGETYRRLRMHAAIIDQAHRSILEIALAEYLNRVIA